MSADDGRKQPGPHRGLIRGCLMLTAALLLLLTLLAVLNPLFLLGFVEEPYQTWRSPDGAWELILTAGPAWIFGPHPLYAYKRALPVGLPQRIFAFEIANDGAVLRAELCHATWPDPVVVALTCEGQEQPPTTYLVDIAAGRLLETDDPRQ